MQSDN